MDISKIRINGIEINSISLLNDKDFSLEAYLDRPYLCEYFDEMPRLLAERLRPEINSEGGIFHEKHVIFKDGFDDEEEMLKWRRRIFSHINYEITLHTKSLFINERLRLASIQGLTVPDSVSRNTIGFSGRFESLDKIQTKVLAANSCNDDVNIGDMDDVGYWMIEPFKGIIVPIARADEHNQGYDLLRTLISKGEVPGGNYISIFSYHDNYAPDESRSAELALFIGALKIWRRFGGPNLPVNITRGRERGICSMDEFIKCEGQAVKILKVKNGLRNNGVKLIKHLENVIAGILKNQEGKRVKVDQLFSEIDSINELIQLSSDFRYDAKIMESLKKIDEARYRSDILELEQLVLGFNGVKNSIHTNLKITLEKNNPYTLESIYSVYGDVTSLYEEFNRLGSI